MNSFESFGTGKRNVAHDINKSDAEPKSDHEMYGFDVIFIDNNSVKVRDSMGTEIIFAFPLDNITLDAYDKFINQMRDEDSPLPPKDHLLLAVGKPTMLTGAQNTHAENSATLDYTWRQHAHDHGITIDEMKSMYRFARDALYERFRSRIRGRNSA